MYNSKEILTMLVLSLVSITVNATIKLPVIFQSNMVLQRDKEVSVWGFGNAGEKITIRFKGQDFRSATNKNGKWFIKLPAQVAGGPYDIIVSGKDNSVELKNVLFGDLWICGGQSNMQFTLDQIGHKFNDKQDAGYKDLRIFTATIGMDYIPKDDLAGGEWKHASIASLKNFSATAYFFGKFLMDSLNVPIGLVSDNLGATSVETWMSAEALSKFPQFSDFHKTFLAPAKSFKEVTAAFEKTKSSWQESYYLKGEGLQQKWYLPETDTAEWKMMEIPSWWEDKGMADFDGAVWFRKTFDLPQNFKEDAFHLALNQIDDYDMVWVNGIKVGEGYGNQNWRNYSIPANILKPAGNVIVVRVFDAGGKGGMYSHAIWGNPILLGNWLYKQDSKIDAAAFPKPHVVNISPFNTPAILYNGNIAPVTSLAIKGFIWYQGESNASRASEYRELFPAMITDWRTKFRQGDLTFLFVQLANFMQEQPTPVQSDWAELRDAQAAALKLPNAGMAVAIDIGDPYDIHPKNKMDVGKRLGIAALKIAYKKDVISKGPTYQSMEVNDNKIIIHFESGTDHLVTKNKYGYISGFAIAGADNKFHWARATIKNNTVVVNSKEVSDPRSVRYAWADNPGALDLYNAEGLPAVPFRTDSLPLKTSGKVFSEDPWTFK